MYYQFSLSHAYIQKKIQELQFSSDELTYGMFEKLVMGQNEQFEDESSGCVES